MADVMTNRRPIQARDTAWASRVACLLIRLKINPNTISLTAVVFALLAGASFFLSFYYAHWVRSSLLFAGAGFIQLRLLCNLFDGMVAIEGGMQSKSGEIFNDFPDRLADPLILIGIGYAVRGLPLGVELGWLAGLLAVMAAYVRYLGVAAGAGSYFWGPMAKQHRMAAATIAAVLQAILCFWFQPFYVLYTGLVIIVTGCLITVFRRVIKIVRILERS